MTYLDYRNAVAEEVRAAMGRKGVTKSELGRRIGQSHRWVGDRANGKIPFDVDELFRVAEALDVDVALFVSPTITTRYPSDRRRKGTVVDLTSHRPARFTRSLQRAA